MTAKEMFDDCGYIQSVNDKRGICYNYNFPNYTGFYSYIWFNKKEKKVETESNVTIGADFTMAVMKAINKQVEQLKYIQWRVRC